MLCLQPYQMYQWTYADAYHDTRPMKSFNQNGVNGENADEIDSTSSIEAIKSRLLACDSVNSIIAEMKGALNEIESHADIETHNKSQLQRCEPLNGVDRVDHDDVKIEFKSSTEFCKNCAVKQPSCDSQKEHSSVDKNTQTESESESKVKNSQTAIPIPIPPPMPNFLMSPMPSIVVVTEAKETISVQMEQQSISCTPQVMNASAETTDDKENVPCTPANIPIAPPLPTNYIGSSASSFCPPPPPMPWASSGGMPLPPPMPIPSDKNIWFKSDSKFPKTIEDLW